MPLTPQDWHRRFSQQARWTQDLRRYLYQRLPLDTCRTALDVGCGTGVLLAELGAYLQLAPFGLDIDAARLDFARQHAPGSLLTCGDAHRLPYADGSFDLCLCHFLLLWVAGPQAVLHEMARVTRPGGAVLALAEPDYGGRVDYPAPLAQLGAWQAESLRRQGAEPNMGRRLAALFQQAGLREIEVGVLGGQWTAQQLRDAGDGEWEMLRADLEGMAPPSRLQELHALDQAARQRGERVLFVPTFYAWGKV